VRLSLAEVRRRCKCPIWINHDLGDPRKRPSRVWFVPKAEVAMVPLPVEGAAVDLILSPFTVSRWVSTEAVGDRDDARRIDPHKTCCGWQMSYVSVGCRAWFIQLAAPAARDVPRRPRGSRARCRPAAAPGRDSRYTERSAASWRQTHQNAGGPLCSESDRQPFQGRMSRWVPEADIQLRAETTQRLYSDPSRSLRKKTAWSSERLTSLASEAKRRPSVQRESETVMLAADGCGVRDPRDRDWPEARRLPSIKSVHLNQFADKRVRRR
jgi:hypothetical protein